MEYYVALEGEKVGPLSQFRLVEMLRDGEVSPDNKAWHMGLDAWMPLSEVPSMSSTVEAMRKSEIEEAMIKSQNRAEKAGIVIPPEIRAEKKIPIAVEVRPLTRFWARFFDYSLVAMLVVVFSDVEYPRVDPDISLADLVTRYEEIFSGAEFQQLARMQAYALLLWHVLEGILISLFGTTPGKALFGISIATDEGSRVSVMNGIIRSFLVFALGLGCFFHEILMLAALTFAFFRLMSRGITVWDQVLHLQVKHPPLSLVRILLAIMAFFALMMLQFVKI